MSSLTSIKVQTQLINPNFFDLNALLDNQALICVDQTDHGMILFKKNREVVALNHLFKAFLENNHSLHTPISFQTQRSATIETPCDYYEIFKLFFPRLFNRANGYKWIIISLTNTEN